MHAVSPTVKFVDASNGFIFYWPTPYPDGRLIRTDDRGRTWQPVTGKLDFPIVVNATHWYEVAVGCVRRTENAGRDWSETPIPQLGYVDRTFFLSPDAGWIASTDGDDFLIFRTADGGRTWLETRTHAPAQLTDVRELFFLSHERGWLITFHSLYDGSYVYATTDGGQTWVQESDRSFQGVGKWTSTVRFLSERMGFLFGSELEGPTVSGEGAPLKSQTRYSLTYTTDGGAHWHKAGLPRRVSDCQVLKDELRCSAGGAPAGFNVLTVRPK
jgi:photosystem II stability/assembly factor-like uncharacterized protein